MLAACERCGDRFLFTVLAEIGLWIDEALGLRHNDIDVAAWVVTVSTRVARAKSGSRQIPVSAIPCSSNLWAEPVGAPMKAIAVSMTRCCGYVSAPESCSLHMCFGIPTPPGLVAAAPGRHR